MSQPDDRDATIADLRSRLAALEKALRHAHKLLDMANADVNNAACQYCPAEGYDGDGLNHDEDCIISTIRRLLPNGTAGAALEVRDATG